MQKKENVAVILGLWINTLSFDSIGINQKNNRLGKMNHSAKA